MSFQFSVFSFQPEFNAEEYSQNLRLKLKTEN